MAHVMKTTTTTTTTTTVAVALLTTCKLLVILGGSMPTTMAVPARREWRDALPVLATFATYEEMQHYFDERNARSLRQLDNPTNDTYVNAFNQHNEQPVAGTTSLRLKRAASTQHQLPNAPTLLKFELSDAVEPSEELKALMRQHRSRDEEKQQESAQQMKQKKVKKTRNKRATKKETKQSQEPQDFQVQLIPFEVGDAREPDERTKRLISHMRALDLQKMFAAGGQQQQQVLVLEPVTAKTPTTTTTTAPTSDKKSKSQKTRTKTIKRKRTRRSTSHTPPQMIKFELEDAKVPHDAFQALLQQQQHKQRREGKELPTKFTLLTNELQREPNVTATSKNEIPVEDQSSNESKRYFFYKEPPTPTAVVKTKKSINSLPHEVQKVISHIMKEPSHGGGNAVGGASLGKAYLRLLPAHQVDYGSLKAATGAYYNVKAAQTPQAHAPAYVKYVPIQQHQPPKVATEIHTVPVVEKVRYVFTPVYTPVAAAPAAPSHVSQNLYLPQKYIQAIAAPANTISQPIVVSEQHQQQPQQHQEAPQPQQQVVHHTYAADLSHIHEEAIADNVATDAKARSEAIEHFRPSKPDPVANEAEHANAAAAFESYKYAAAAAAAEQQQQHNAVEAVASPVIKIEYHTTAAHALPEDYKQLAEFQELSTLVGKSPEDQIHGLTYLLAKEMQSKLQSKTAALEALLSKRPQDSTSPILFHPEQQGQQQQQPATVHLGNGGSQQIIGMAKTKEYIPIVEHTSANSHVRDEQAAATETQTHAANEAQVHAETQIDADDTGAKLSAAKVKHPSSYVEFALSPNYEQYGSKLHNNHNFVVDRVIHHPTNIQKHQHALNDDSGGGSKAANLLKGLSFHDGHGLQYASKYAFGYRIRDFHTGNDFGHKQNRDLDGVTRGQYHILLPDGRIQNVIYHADDTGFHADVSFESGQ